MSNDGISSGMDRNDSATMPCWMKQLPRKRCVSWYEKEKSTSFFSYSSVRSSGVSSSPMPSSSSAGVRTGWPSIGFEAAVDAHARLGVRRQHEVGRAGRGHRPEEVLDGSDVDG